jgi:hypothetical protein
MRCGRDDIAGSSDMAIAMRANLFSLIEPFAAARVSTVQQERNA